MTATQDSTKPREDSPLDRINERLDMLLRGPYAGILITPIRQVSGDTHSALGIGLASLDANMALQKMLQHIDLMKMIEYSNSGQYLDAFKSLFSDSGSDIDKVKTHIQAFKSSFSNGLSTIAGDLTVLELSSEQTPSSDLVKTKERLSLFESIVPTVERNLEPRLGALSTFFANAQNAHAVIGSLRHISSLAETDTRSIGSALSFRKYLLGGAALGLGTYFSLSAMLNPLIQAPVLFLLAVPLLILASSFSNGNKKRNAEVQNVQDTLAGFLHRQLMPVPVRTEQPKPVRLQAMRQVFANLARGAEKPDLTAMLDVCKIQLQHAPCEGIEAFSDKEQLSLPNGSYSEDPAHRSPLAKAMQAATAFVWSLSLAFAPLVATLGLSWLATKGDNSWPDKTLLSQSAGRESCQLAHGRVFLQTWDNIYVRTYEPGKAAEIGNSAVKILPRSSIVETRYGNPAGQSGGSDLKPCGTVEGLYNPHVAVHSNPTINTPVQVAGPTIHVNQAAAIKSPEGVTLLPRQRSVILPFFQSDIRKYDSIRNRSLKTADAFELGFKQSNEDALKMVLGALRQSFLACRNLPDRIKLDIKGYASNKIFDGVSTNTSDELNYWLAEGRRAGVMNAIGIQPPLPAKRLLDNEQNAGLSIDLGTSEPPAQNGFRFRSYEDMRQNLQLWHLEPRGTDNSQTEAFARSVVISFDDQELRKCDQIIKTSGSRP